MFDIVMYDDGNMEGFDIINPEGETYYSHRVAIEWSPGYSNLLQGAEEIVREVSARRAVLEQEAAKRI